MSKIMTTQDIYRQYVALTANKEKASDDFAKAVTDEEIKRTAERLDFCTRQFLDFKNMMWEKV